MWPKKIKCENLKKIVDISGQENSIILLYLAIKYNQKIKILVLLCVCTLIK